ncbi:MAG: copper resistance protein CopC, partial [Actinomycetia bacterium]|nr:copper resistance protein CopC [Actinomycetes bacterium]
MPTKSPQGPTWQRVTVIVIALLIVAALILPMAMGHAMLLSSSPQDGEQLGSTEEVSLTFNEDISPDFVQLEVRGPDGVVSVADPTVDGAVVTQPIEPTSAGEHVLSYRVVSADGHPVSGEVTFELTDVAAPAEADPTEDAPTEDVTTGADAATTEP